VIAWVKLSYNYFFGGHWEATHRNFSTGFQMFTVVWVKKDGSEVRLGSAPVAPGGHATLTGDLVLKEGETLEARVDGEAIVWADHID